MTTIRGGAEIGDVLRRGELVPDGVLVDSSNRALVGSVTRGGITVRCVYKPIRGERPLWDFPDGTLAAREVAASLVAQTAGWDCVPATVFRDGPLGPGMVQEWIADAAPDRVADLLPAADVPDSWLPVLAARDEAGRRLLVAHADEPALATLAAFDLAVNNADRKASHILATADGRIRGVDHGLTFHQEPKLRTILWGWAGRPLPANAVDGLRRLADAMDASDADLAVSLSKSLSALISDAEIAALRTRIRRLLAEPVFPLPPTDRTAIPWPPL
ncbi:MAG: phosphatidylinositol kinase [Actinobacteria bacterium 69-20]|jgi:uncharacterized repeat protein (TIGR03843 family)|nr:SCO1664 family protein [Actinomycetota bacterium]OJV26032.1 MAG: phosphatidylinositol kinase [Actinobacteria bacterium 69-20]